jgi:rhodanese-related sulfurtransferase
MMGLETISPDALHRSLPDGRVHVFDLNSPQSWAKARVPGAKRLEPESWSADELPAAKDARLVFYCSNPLCLKAPSAAKRAQKLGYTDVAVLSAGISGWLSAGLPTEAGG